MYIMKRSSFLTKLKKEYTLTLVEPSDEIAQSYLIKSDKCIQVARLAYEAGIYENAISEAYYSMYHAVTALFYKCGIKCENHSGAVILMKELFNLNELYAIFSEFKKARIDNQYHVPSIGLEPITKEDCDTRLKTAHRFTTDLRVCMGRISIREINEVRKDVENL